MTARFFGRNLRAAKTPGSLGTLCGGHDTPLANHKQRRFVPPAVPSSTETQRVTAPSLARLEPATAPLLPSVRGTPALEQREERRERLLLGQITAGSQHDYSEAQLVCNRALVEISRAGRAELRPSNTVVRCDGHELT